MDNENIDNNPQEIDIKKSNATKDQKLIDEQIKKYTDGEVLKFIRVRFPGHAKSFPFLLGKKQYEYGQKVVALSDRGMAVGYVNSFPYEKEFEKTMLPLRNINKVATEDDLDQVRALYQKEQDAEDLCKKLIRKHELEMDLTHVEFTQFGKKAVFYFVAPHRVDFRGLVKDLVSDLKMRIELRQISTRDRAAALGGVGPCGRELCCSTFLSRYGHVNIKLAKNQNLTLNQSRLNGLCGQLKCCLTYEDDVYSYKRNMLPKEGDFISCKNGDLGKVTKLYVLIEQFEMLTDQGIFRRYTADQFNKDQKLPNNWEFPKEFRAISKELSNVIGMNDSHSEQVNEFEKFHNQFTISRTTDEINENDQSSSETLVEDEPYEKDIDLEENSSPSKENNSNNSQVQTSSQEEQNITSSQNNNSKKANKYKKRMNKINKPSHKNKKKK